MKPRQVPSEQLGCESRKSNAARVSPETAKFSCRRPSRIVLPKPCSTSSSSGVSLAILTQCARLGKMPCLPLLEECRESCESIMSYTVIGGTSLTVDCPQLDEFSVGRIPKVRLRRRELSA